MFLGRHLVDALLRQMPGRCVGELFDYLRQSSLGRVPLFQLVLAIADLEQGIGTLARLRIFVDYPLKSALSLRKRLVDVVGLAQPILSVVRERTLRIHHQELLKRRDGTIVLTILQQVEGSLIRGLVVGTGRRGTPAGAARTCVARSGRGTARTGAAARLETFHAPIEIGVQVALLFAARF